MFLASWLLFFSLGGFDHQKTCPETRAPRGAINMANIHFPDARMANAGAHVPRCSESRTPAMDTTGFVRHATSPRYWHQRRLLRSSHPDAKFVFKVWSSTLWPKHPDPMGTLPQRRSKIYTSDNHHRICTQLSRSKSVELHRQHRENRKLTRKPDPDTSQKNTWKKRRCHALFFHVHTPHAQFLLPFSVQTHIQKILIFHFKHMSRKCIS